MKFASVLLLTAAWARASVYFEPNRGQAPAAAAFVSRTGHAAMALRPNGLEYRGRTLLTFEGARAAAPGKGEEPLPGVTHYARGSDPARWVWGVPHYARVRFAGIYPEIDLVYRSSVHRGSGGRVEFDFELAAGAEPSRIRMRAVGARILESGTLEVAGIRLPPPAAWQTVAGTRVPVEVAFTRLRGGRVGFRFGAYDRRAALTIDPILEFATYLGGSDDEDSTQVLGGSDGAVYVAGSTVSADFPAALPDNDLLNRPVTLIQSDVYVTRLKADASAMDWSIFIGGTGADTVVALRRDGVGNLYVFGETSSTNLPVTAGAYRTRINATLADGFVVKLDEQTGRIKACTYLGLPIRQDVGALAAVDAAGGVYVAADVTDAATQATPGAYQTSSAAGTTYVTRLNSGLSAQVYGTFFNLGRPTAMDVDSAGNLVLGGSWQNTASVFPAVTPIPGISQSASGQAMIVRLNSTGSALTFASLLHGGGRQSNIFDLKITPAGEIWVIGATGGGSLPQVNPLALDPLPANFPVVPDSFWASPFLVQLSASGGTLLQSTLLYGPEYTPPGGQGTNANKRILLRPSGSLCVTNLPITPRQTQGGLLPITDNFYYGGSLYCLDDARTKFTVKTGLPVTSGYTSVAGTVDDAVLFGGTASQGFATTPGVVQPGYAGGVSRDRFNLFPSFGTDAVVLRVSLKNPAPAIARVTPDTILLDAGFSGSVDLLVDGAGLAYGMDATVDGTPAAFSMVSATQAKVSPQADALQAGVNPLRLSMAGPGGGSAQTAVNGINVTPSQIAVSPVSVTQGAAETKLVVSGGNLTAQSVLRWNGEVRQAKFVGDQRRLGHFELLLEPPEMAQPLVAQIAFSNPPPGGGTSPVALFTVQPASGAQAPRLNGQLLFILGSAATAGPKLTVGGGAFAAGLHAFWDGAEVPVDVTSASAIAITPPVADLARVGQHSVYVSLNGLISATVPLIFARNLSPGAAVADLAHQKLYVLAGPANAQAQFPDLVILDMRQGDVLETLQGAGAGVTALAVSEDGTYLYEALNDVTGNTAKASVRRYNTVARQVDLSWALPEGAYVNSIMTVPGSPETSILTLSGGAMAIYDGNQPRANSFPNSGQQTVFLPLFVTRNRVFTATGGPCWSWMDFDATGFTKAQVCASEPAEARRDSGLTYLTDGTHNYPTSLPTAGLVSVFGQTPQFAMDLARRRVFQLSSNGSTRTLTTYDMDSQVQRTLFTLGFGTPVSGLWINGNGAAVVLSYPYLTIAQ